MVSRNYCWTLNNWTDSDEEELLGLPGCIKYICWGREIGPENGIPHLQGYLELSKPMRITGVKKICGAAARMHLEVRRGTTQEAITYTQEDGDWREVGKRGRAGERADLDRVRQQALSEGMRGVTLTGNMQQIRVAEKFLTYHEEPRDEAVEVEWIWGPSGAGKSKLAREKTATQDTFVKNEGSKWWDGYDGHEAVILDDFRDSWWSLTETLSLLDRYEKRVEVKGGWRQLRATRIIITSIKPPTACYKIADEDARQLLRRIHTVTELCNEVGGVILAPLPVLTNEELEELLSELV